MSRRAGKSSSRPPPHSAKAATTFCQVKNETARLRLTGMIQIQDTLPSCSTKEKSDGDEARMTTLRARLFQSMTLLCGAMAISIPRPTGAHAGDLNIPLLESLELEYDKGLSPDTARKHGGAARPASAKKAAIFRQQVLKPAGAVERAETIKDALLIALRKTAGWISAAWRSFYVVGGRHSGELKEQGRYS